MTLRASKYQDQYDDELVQHISRRGLGKVFSITGWVMAGIAAVAMAALIVGVCEAMGKID